MNNIEKKKNVWQSLVFEPYPSNPNRDADHYCIEHLWCFNTHLKNTRTSFLTSDILDSWQL